MGFLLYGAKLKWWKCRVVPDVCMCSWNCSISDYFQNNKWQWRSFLMGKESQELQRTQKRSLHVNTGILVCWLWASRFFFDSCEIYYSTMFYQGVFSLLIQKWLQIPHVWNIFSSFFFLSTNNYLLSSEILSRRSVIAL